MSDTFIPFQVYLPATADKPAEPAPWVMTDDEVIRFLRLTCTDAYQALKRYRLQGLLKGTQVGRQVRYALPDVVKFLESARESNPR